MTTISCETPQHSKTTPLSNTKVAYYRLCCMFDSTQGRAITRVRTQTLRAVHNRGGLVVQLRKQNITIWGLLQTASSGYCRGELVNQTQTSRYFASFDTRAKDLIITEDDRQELNIPITRDSHRQVRVANWHVEQGKHANKLPFTAKRITSRSGLRLSS